MTAIRTDRIIAALFLLVTLTMGAQEVSEKQDLAVFRLGTYDVTVPPAILGSVDSAIQQVFINIGRFNVLGMTYRLGRGDVQAFVDKIRQYKEENIEIPEEVQMGKEFFTEADLNAILGSFIVVIPSVDYFDIEGSRSTTTTTTTRTTTAPRSTAPTKTPPPPRGTTTTTVQRDTTGEYHATLQASFTFVNIAEMRAVAQATIETHGYDDDRELAGQEAVDDLPTQLTYEVRKIEEFKLKTGILEIDGRTVIMELGRDLGVMVGDEYEIVGTRVLASGRTLETRSGLLVIREVSDEVSIAQIIYARESPQVGDQLKEYPLLGATVLPYAQVVLGTFVGSRTVILPGVRAVWNRGLFRFKPQAGVEIPIAAGGLPLVTGGLPVNLYVGGQMDLYLGRLQVNPMVSIGVGGAVPLADTDEFYLSHLGFKAAVNATFLLADKVKLSADGGFTYWTDLRSLDRDYFGPVLAVGAEIKL